MECEELLSMASKLKPANPSELYTIAELNLVSGRLIVTFLDGDWYSQKNEICYIDWLNNLLNDVVINEERKKIQNMFSLDQLQKLVADGKKKISIKLLFRIKESLCRMKLKGIFFLAENKIPSMTLILQDINSSGINAHECMKKQYEIALRSIYDEFYEINLTHKTYRVLYYTPNSFIVPGIMGNLETLKNHQDKMIHPDDIPKFVNFLNNVLSHSNTEQVNESFSIEVRKLWGNLEYHWASITVFSVRQNNVYLCFIMDIQEKKHLDKIAEENRILQLSQMDNERYRIIIEQTDTMVFEWSRESNKRFYCEKLKKTLLGSYDGREIFKIWLDDKIVFYRDIDKLVDFRQRCLDQKMFSNQSYNEISIRLKNTQQDFRWYRIAITCVMDENQLPKRILGTINDVDEGMRFERTLKYRADYDPLTGIYNADTFYRMSAMMLGNNPEKRYAILRMDINRFKLVNDLYGRDEGDRMLKFIANLLQVVLKDGSIFGRISSDVFCVCIPFDCEQELISLTQYFSDHIAQYCIGYTVVPSFGICLVEDRSIPISTLCDWANLALRTVKGNMITKYAFYDEKLRAKQLDERTIEEEMQQALQDGQFCIYLQPKHDLRTGCVIGAEALVRWRHPEKGLIVPDRFIPLFERNGFIIRLDEYVWEDSCKVIGDWINKGYKPVPISMNVSRIHIYNPGFGDRICNLMEKYQIPPGLIELELTESTFIENPNELYTSMKVLQDKGFTFSMDDFGSGYSSLNMLKNVPVNTIKLDREFLNETASTLKGKTVIECTIAMAERLNLHVIAEGVETEKQAEFLLGAGCTVAQGYYFSKPMPIDEFEEKVFKHNIYN